MSPRPLRCDDSSVATESVPPGLGCESVTMYDHQWFWRSRLPDRKGQRCRILARGKMNSLLVEFCDGWKVITSRYAVRRVKEPTC